MRPPRRTATVLLATTIVAGSWARTAGRELADQAAAAWLGVPVSHLPAWDRTCEHCGHGHGKPWLPGTDLDLSLTRAGPRLLVAGVRSPQRRLRVGLDAERLEVLGDAGVRRRFLASGEVLSAAEQRAVETRRTSPAADRADCSDHELLTRWVRKEALLKASGLGLAVPLAAITLGERDGSPALEDWDEERAGHRGPGGPVTLVDVPLSDAGPGPADVPTPVVAALAVQGTSHVRWRWSEPAGAGESGPAGR